MTWSPNPGPQTTFCATSAHECLYGGAAGGGKSAALIAQPLRWVHVPEFRALILRRESTQLGNLLDKAAAIYPNAGARFVGQKSRWIFPSGATIWFSHCEHERDVARYDGDEFQWIGFDELTHFTLAQYVAIKARIRSSTPGLPRHCRATTNPGGAGHEWVFDRWRYWLDPKAEPRAAPGQLLWIGRDPDGTERATPHRRAGARTRQFVPARLSDNPHLVNNDPDYAANLNDLDPVRRAQLRDGDWLIKPARGLYFKREWFEVVPGAPADAARVRYWDRAATPDGDWTVGLRLARTRQGVYVIEHVDRFRGAPGVVHTNLRQRAEADGPGVVQVLEEDPGQAGVVERATLAQLLNGLTYKFVRPTGDKVTRAGPASSAASQGNIRVVGGTWLGPLLDELTDFPDGRYDDQVDALSGAFGQLQSVGVTLPVGTTRGEPRRSMQGW